MVKGDLYKCWMEEEGEMGLLVKDMVDDRDEKDGLMFKRLYGDWKDNGMGIGWDDIL